MNTIILYRNNQTFEFGVDENYVIYYENTPVKTYINTVTGYEQFNVVKDKRYLFYTHRIICEAFNGPAPEGKPVVDHIDDNRANNRPENLHWVSKKENNSKSHARKMKSANSHSGVKSIIEATDGINIKYFNHGTIASRTLGISLPLIYKALNDENYKCKGWSLKWVEMPEKTKSIRHPGTYIRITKGSESYLVKNKNIAGFIIGCTNQNITISANHNWCPKGWKVEYIDKTTVSENELKNLIVWKDKNRNEITTNN